MAGKSAKSGRTISKPLKSEQGAALVIALLAVVVLTMFGLILLQVLRGSQVQAASSEAAVQAEAIAQRGIDDALALIRHAVDQGNADGATYRDKIAKADQYLNNVKTFIAGSAEIGAKRGTYRISIENETDNYTALAGSPATTPDFPYVRIFTIRSKGVIANHPGGMVTKQMQVVVSTINPVFRYPLSGDNNVSLHGAPYIVGDVLANDGDLNVSDVAMFTGLPDTVYGKKSDYPSIKGFVKFSGKVVEYYPNTSDIKRSAANVEEAWFSKAVPLYDAKLAAGDPVDTSAYVGQKITEMTGKIDAVPSPFAENPLTGDLLGTQLGSGSGMLIDHSVKYEDQWITAGQKLTVGSPSAAAGSGAGDFAVKNGVLQVLPGAEFKLNRGSLYVSFHDPYLVAADLSGSLAVDPGESAVIDGNCTLNSGFSFTGNMYMKGDLKVVGSINVDGTIYVDGNVELKQMTSINDAVAKPLIVAATGTFDFSDNTNTSNNLRAFLYSAADIKLQGVKSKIKIYGGVHGHNIALNAVREDTSSIPTDNTYIEFAPPSGGNEEAFVFSPGQSSLAPEQSKLQIFFDSALYSEPPVGIPTTSEVTVFVKEIETVR